MRKSVPYGGRAMTLEQISQELGVTRERVRQIERDALKKINARLKARGITAADVLPAAYEEAKA